MNTMNLPKRLLDAASTDKTREVLHGALVDADHRCVVVCNGRILALTPIPGDVPVKPAYITPEKLKMAKAKNTKELVFDFAAGTLNGIPLDEPDVNGNYPNYRQVIPDFAPCYRAKLDPTLIAHLAGSLGFANSDTAGFVFEFDDDHRTGVRISFGDAQAIIMPMSCPDKTGLLTGSGDADTLRKENAKLKKQLSERSDNTAHPAVAASAADAALIESLKSELHQTRARVRQLEAQMPAPTVPLKPAPPVKQLDAKPAGKAAAKSPKAPVPLASGRPTVAHNAERDGVELRFNGKPDDATRLAMKERGFRWLPGKPGQPWAAKYSEEVWLFANSLATGDAYTPMPQPQAAPAPAEVPPISQWTRSTILPVQPQPTPQPAGPVEDGFADRHGNVFDGHIGPVRQPAAEPTPAAPAVPSRVRNITLHEF